MTEGLPPYHEFWPALQAACARSGITSGDLADTIGWSRAHLAEYRAGFQLPDGETVLAIQQMLSVPDKELVRVWSRLRGLDRFTGIHRRKFDGNGRIRVPKPWLNEAGELRAFAYASGPGVIFRTPASFPSVNRLPVDSQHARQLTDGRTSVSNIIYEAAGLHSGSWVVLIGAGDYFAMVEDQEGWQGRFAETSVADPINASPAVEPDELQANMLRTLEPLISELRKFLDDHGAALGQELREEMEELVEDVLDQLRRPRGVRVLIWTLNLLMAFLVSLTATVVGARYQREINGLIEDLIGLVSRSRG